MKLKDVYLFRNHARIELFSIVYNNFNVRICRLLSYGKGRVQFSMRVNRDNYTFESWAKKCQKLEENASNKIKILLRI